MKDFTEEQRGRKTKFQKKGELNDTELMEKAASQNLPEGKKRRNSFLPKKENCGINFAAMSQAAAQHGVLIGIDGSFITFKEPKNSKDYEAYIGGRYEVVEIPSHIGKKARTVMLVNKNVHNWDLPENGAARYITMQEIKGAAIWLPREYVK